MAGGGRGGRWRCSCQRRHNMEAGVNDQAVCDKAFVAIVPTPLSYVIRLSFPFHLPRNAVLRRFMFGQL